MLADVELTSERLRIRRSQIGDAEASYKWFSNPEVTRYLPLAGRGHLPMDAIREHLSVASTSDRPGVSVTIDTTDGRAIGCGGFRCFSNASAELSLVIGDPAFWGCGVGAEALALLLSLGFERLGLAEIWLITRLDNARAVRLFRHAGFRTAETLRGAALVDGVAYDKLRMTLGREQWNSAEPAGVVVRATPKPSGTPSPKL